MTYKLYLDDIRFPHFTFPTTKDSEWVIARSYDEFVKTLKDKGIPFIVSFDHDLADEHYQPEISVETYKEKTGMDCAKHLVEVCMEQDRDLPKWFVHSANPVGAANIRSYLESYTKSRQ
jgi:hypothetical protein